MVREDPATDGSGDVPVSVETLRRPESMFYAILCFLSIDFDVTALSSDAMRAGIPA